MTITTNDTRDEYTATAGQTTFNYTFKIFADTDLLVYQTASGATPDDTTDLITAYTVTGVGNANGGTIVLDTGATLNDKITIVSNISYERDTDYQFNGDYTADVVNDEQDKQLSLIKQVKEEISRTMQFPRSAQSATGKVLPQPSDLADCVLAFDSNGDPVAGPSATSMQALIDAAEAVLLNSNAGAVSYVNTTSGLAATNVQTAIDEVDADLDTAETKIGNLITLSGVAANATSLGTFTGSIIPDSSTIKAALQALETRAEAAGTWSPTIVNVTNMEASGIYGGGSGLYSRVGSVVNFSIGIAVNPTASGAFQFDLTLPVASNFANAYDAAGCGVNKDSVLYNCIVIANTTNDRLAVYGYANTTTELQVFITGQYLIK